MRPVRALLTALFTALPTLAIAAESPISGARQLTFEGKRAGEGYFAADGSAMIFQSERDEKNPFYQMYLMDLESGDVDLMSPGIGKTTCGWIAPDGSKVMFSSTHHEPEAEAKMQAELDFRASGQTRRYSWDYDPEYEIFARDLATGEFTRLTDAPGYDAEGSYSPDGSKILFASNRHAYSEELTEAEAKRLEIDPSYFMDLYVMDGDGSNVRRLTDVPGYDGGPFWSADGSQFTWRRFSESGKTAEVFVANADGSNQRPVTDMGVMSWAPFFHPSGAYLIFNTNLLGFANFELYIVDVAGTREPVRVSDRDGFDGLATFTPDGKKISWTSNARSPSARFAASRQLAKASGSRLSRSSPFCARWRSSFVFSMIPSSVSAANSSSRALIAPTWGSEDLTLRSLGVPKTFFERVPSPSIFIQPLGAFDRIV